MKTTNYNIIPLFSLLAFLLLPTSCTDELATDPGRTSNGQTPRFVISTNSPQTRVSYGNITKSTFEEGDVLGAFVLDANGNIVTNPASNVTYANIQYRVAGDGADGMPQTLQPVLPRDAFPYADGYRYIFYYPFREGTDYDDVTHTVQTDQSTARLYELSDLLWDYIPYSGTSTPEGTAPTVEVAMDHAMSNIVLEVPQEMMSAEAPHAWMLNVKIMVSDISLAAENLSDLEGTYGTAETVNAETIGMWRFGTRTLDNQAMWQFRIAIPAQEFENNTEMFSIQTEDGKTATYTAQFSGGNLTFLPGRYYLFTVTETGLRFRGLIEDLEDGGDYYYEY